MLVLAAAGTGKTRTLVYRVAHLVERGVRPWNILLLTFTNRAAREMLERAQQVIGPSAGDVWGGTFHSIANRMLRRHADRLGFLLPVSQQLVVLVLHHLPELGFGFFRFRGLRIALKHGFQIIAQCFHLRSPPRYAR